MEIVGYSNVLSVQPGRAIEFMISSKKPRYHARIIRLGHGQPDQSADLKTKRIPSTIEGEYPGKFRELRPGSYIRVPHRPLLDLIDGFSLLMWIYPTLPNKGAQTLLSNGNFYCLQLDEGRLRLHIEDQTFDAKISATPNIWHFAAAVYDRTAGEVRLLLEPNGPSHGHGEFVSYEAQIGHLHHTASDLMIAARSSVTAEGELVSHFYNGKIESPQIFREALTLDQLHAVRDDISTKSMPKPIASWDFAIGIPTTNITDLGEHGVHGVTVQRPTRGVTGHKWDGTEMCWKYMPAHYDAIHFHEDDLDDANWGIDFRWDVPEDVRSGIYAAHLQTDKGEDYIPFAVRPKTGGPTARLAFLMPVFSYMAYANEQMLEGMEEMLTSAGLDVASLDYPSTPEDNFILGAGLLSTYDTHTDGTGVCYSSRLRPMVNMRPGYHMPMLASPHQFSADLILVDWLNNEGYEFDVITDEDLHRDGLQLLAPYAAVLTGTHCEYWSSAMIFSMQEFLASGGRLMYLGGNGMYWVTQLDAEGGHTIEVRRLGPGTRTWEPAPGEGYLSFTGELGGLWRYRGQSPQSWLGVGFTAAGGVAIGRPFVRDPGSFNPAVSWIFEGIEDNEVIGDFPSLIIEHGAAAQEIDRMDHALGSPSTTNLLASASGFSDLFQHVSEEVFMSDSLQGGTVSRLVRADMVLLPYPRGGAVFSVASVAWCGCLPYNNYRNNVSRITRNVLEKFLAREPLLDS